MKPSWLTHDNALLAIERREANRDRIYGICDCFAVAAAGNYVRDFLSQTGAPSEPTFVWTTIDPDDERLDDPDDIARGEAERDTYLAFMLAWADDPEFSV